MSANHKLSPSGSQPGGPFPDFKVCRVTPAVISSLYYCLAPKPAGCPYAEPYRNKTFCFYPDPAKVGGRTA
jgi:hypothetical protein